MQSIQIGVTFANRYCCPPPPVFECFDSTPYRMCLDYERYLWKQVLVKGGVRKMLGQTNGYGMDYPVPPQIQMPATGQRFDKNRSIPLPPNNGLNATVLTYTVPQGWDGVIISFVNEWTGTGFVEGSGDLIWRVKINETWLFDYSDIRFSLGSLQSRYPLEGAYIQLRGGDTVRYFVNHAIASALSGGRIVTGIAGWIYPAV